MNGPVPGRVAGLHVRDRVRLAGFISSVVLRPVGVPRAVEVELSDGTGTITLIWLGQDRIPGIGPGTRLEVEGLVARRGHQLVIYDPVYEIVDVPGQDEG
jgi:hypothetical protein